MTTTTNLQYVNKPAAVKSYNSFAVLNAYDEDGNVAALYFSPTTERVESDPLLSLTIVADWLRGALAQVEQAVGALTLATPPDEGVTEVVARGLFGKCHAEDPHGFICTLAVNHDGDHEAHGVDQSDVCAHWPQVSA